MGIIIDTNILIHYEKGNLDVSSHIQGQEEKEFFLSVITASELLHGVWRAKNSKFETKRMAFVEAVLKSFPILSIDLLTARTHAKLWSTLQSQGLMIGLHDSWIAAQCLTHSHTLVTQNKRSASFLVSIPSIFCTLCTKVSQPL